MKTVLVSVTDKTGLDNFLKRLERFNKISLIATSSTAQYLIEHGFECTKVEDLTQFPEILGGRVKTLHPRVFAGILARSSYEDRKCLLELEIPEIDIVIVNLYEFEEKLAKELSEPNMVEAIDIGGVALLRAAAKNYERVAVLSSPNQYESVLNSLDKERGVFTKELRKSLAHAAFTRTAMYDSCISDYLGQEKSDTISLKLRKFQALRYGENPHQKAVWFAPNAQGNWRPPFVQLQGKEMSSNNVIDTYSLTRYLQEFKTPAVCIIKHNNPCGVALGNNVEEAYDRAYQCDPLSAFGGVYGINGEVTSTLAGRIAENFVEIVLALHFDDGALEIFAKKKNMRVLQLTHMLDIECSAKSWHLRDLGDFGFVAEQQSEPSIIIDNFKCVTKKKADPTVFSDISFAWSVVKHLTSNAIFIARDGISLGFGIGQTSRIASVNQALAQAKGASLGAVLASDGFFPAIDNIESAAKAGISVIVQPGGSIKDDEVIAACNNAKIAMYFTGQRCFRH